MPDADGNPTAEETAAAEQARAQQQQTDTAALQEQLTQAQARNLELEVSALHTANPDLPDAAFAGDDLAAIQTSVTTARATADHIRQTIEAANNGAPPNPATAAAVVQTAITGGTTRQAAAPDGIKGIDRIKFGLAQRS